MKENTNLAIKSTLKLVLFLILIFAFAGRLNYWQGWVFFIHTLLLTVVLFIIFRNKMDLFKERMHPGPGTKKWDIVFYIFFIPAAIAPSIIGPLDSGRFYWTQTLPMWVYIASYLIYTLTIVFLTWAMFVNRWFSSVVRIQKDRKQKVVTTGPYAYVRHPGYAGAIPMFVTMGLIFGSYWAILPGLIALMLLFVRTYLEDTTLQNELQGYKAYTKKVKYRLIPGVW